jgi:uncharacterized membrane protein YjdF
VPPCEISPGAYAYSKHFGYVDTNFDRWLPKKRNVQKWSRFGFAIIAQPNLLKKKKMKLIAAIFLVVACMVAVSFAGFVSEYVGGRIVAQQHTGPY